MANPKLKVFDLSIEKRFWRLVEQTPTCWIWKGEIVKGGYGRFDLRRRWMRRHAHRYSYELHYGQISEGMQVLHKCDNPPCVRPDHLFLGTQSDNIRDAVRKGRWPAVRLTEDQVRNIRLIHTSGINYSQRGLARQFGVNHRTIADIINGTAWVHV